MANQESAPLEHDLGLVADAKAINARMYTDIWQGCEQHLRIGLQKLALLGAMQDTRLAHSALDVKVILIHHPVYFINS